MRDVNSAGYRLRVLCKPRPRAGLVDSRQMFVRRCQPRRHNNGRFYGWDTALEQRAALMDALKKQGDET